MLIMQLIWMQKMKNLMRNVAFSWRRRRSGHSRWRLKFAARGDPGEALTGETWHESISQILSCNDDNAICVILDKLLLRSRRDPNDRVVSMPESALRVFLLRSAARTARFTTMCLGSSA
jgi:hypothetical protein